MNAPVPLTVYHRSKQKKTKKKNLMRIKHN